jgi:NADPH2:quinone reductase
MKRNEMKAVVVESYDSIDHIGLEEVSLPAITSGQVRVKIQAASVGFVDGLKVQGLYQTKDPLPFTPGSEFAGIVDETAADVREFARGTPVMGMARSGGLAEYIAVPATALEIMPEGIAPEVAASFRANYLTSLYALSERAALCAGEHLLVLGAAGGVGIAAVQLGKLLGARVIAAASTEEKRNFATRFGADATVDYTQPDWRDAFRTLTGGHGADVIFDPVGGDIALQAFRSIAWRGRHLVVGFAAGSIPALPFNLPLLKGGALLGVDLAQIPHREPEAQRRVLSQLFTWLKEKKLEPVVGKVFGFADFRDAFRTMQTRSALGKMVVRIS